MSSYAPTLKALAYSRNRIQKSHSPSAREALFITMPVTPSQQSLVNIIDEVNALNDQMPDSIVRYILQAPEKSEVLSKSRDCHIAHFACHAHAEVADPSKSHLLLSDWQTDPLTVADIVTLNLEKLRLAYLSAYTRKQIVR